MFVNGELDKVIWAVSGEDAVTRAIVRVLRDGLGLTVVDDIAEFGVAASGNHSEGKILQWVYDRVLGGSSGNSRVGPNDIVDVKLLTECISCPFCGGPGELPIRGFFTTYTGLMEKQGVFSILDVFYRNTSSLARSS